MSARLLLLSLIAAMSLFRLNAWAEDTQAGFKPLFNGKDLDGWEGDTSLWSFENGEVLGKSPGIKRNEFLASKASYKDFILIFKFKSSH